MEFAQEDWAKHPQAQISVKNPKFFIEIPQLSTTLLKIGKAV